MYDKIDLERKYVSAEKEQLLANKLFSELTNDEQIKCSRINRRLVELHWRCFEEAKKEEKHDVAAKDYIASFEAGFKAEHDLEIPEQNLESEIILPAETPEQHFINGMRYDLGLGVNRNSEEAIQCYKNAAEQEHTSAQFYLGYTYLFDDKIETKSEGFRLIKNAAEKGHLRAQYVLIIAHRKGLGTEINPSEAIRLLKLVVGNGFAQVQYLLAMTNDSDSEMKKNLSEAEEVHLLRLAAEQGFADAQSDLGLCYFHGRGLEAPNPSLGIRWLKLAAEQGAADARRRIGDLDHPQAKFAIALLDNNYSEALALMLENPELEQELLEFELDNSLFEESAVKDLEPLITVYQEEIVDPNKFMTELALSLQKKYLNRNTSCSDLIKHLIHRLFKEINYTEAEQHQLIDLMHLNLDLWAQHDDFSGFKNLKILLHRAQSLEYQNIPQSVLQQIASMLISKQFSQQYTKNLNPVGLAELTYLFSFCEKNPKCTPKDFNDVFNLQLIILSNSEVAAHKLLPKLIKHLKSNECGAVKKPLFIKTILRYLSAETENKMIDNEFAQNIFEELSKIANKTLKSAEKGAFFKEDLSTAKPICQLLATKDSQGLVELLNSKQPLIETGVGL